MDNSPLNKLAAELRLRIYELVLVRPSTIKLNLASEDEDSDMATEDKQEKNTSTQLALTETCKQIREESMDVFLQSHEFNMHPEKFVGDTEQPFNRLHLKQYTDAIANRTSSFCRYAKHSPTITIELPDFYLGFKNQVDNLALTFKEFQASFAAVGLRPGLRFGSPGRNDRPRPGTWAEDFSRKNGQELRESLDNYLKVCLAELEATLVGRASVMLPDLMDDLEGFANHVKQVIDQLEADSFWPETSA